MQNCKHSTVHEARVRSFREREMAKNLPVFSMKHLLVVSLALNVSLILRAMYEREKWSLYHALSLQQPRSSVINRCGSPEEAHVSTNKHLSISLPSLDMSTSIEAEDQDGGERIINLDHGDPTMYEKYWQQVGDKTTIVIPGWQSMSYFSDVNNICWFLEPELAKEVVRLHKVVGNAITENHHIVVGTGSTQLFQAALYALSTQDASEPISVVSAAPYYSSYPSITDCLKSQLYKWAGDAQRFDKDGPYIELVTSPNNPDGFVRRSVVNRSGGVLVHDLAYYWPQYTAISFPADHDLMLFTVSKSTGHAGMRIGWALVKDTEVAKKMTKFIELNTIGVSKDSQLRAAKVLKVVSDSCEPSNREIECFFEFSHQQMAMRWKQLRVAVKKSGLFSVPDFPPQFCTYLGRAFEPRPAFAWLKCEQDINDCESFLRSKKILTRSGKHFGFSPKYVRISIIDRDENFNLFTRRLSKIIS
ncbi:tryptophan aminotransferase-related protein 2-like isoform X2 [Mangifera indica]|uniref:tryptophan aminotransferase-related protein 2-like isoform X2 n=1 Tax=Mangifera indica TaxID=29780 RepID=UPI001CF9F3FA|nr:tryptophan aminotransferase-related protein 2-like isoform X2 [Mangifera indica]